MWITKLLTMVLLIFIDMMDLIGIIWYEIHLFSLIFIKPILSYVFINMTINIYFQEKIHVIVVSQGKKYTEQNCFFTSFSSIKGCSITTIEFIYHSRLNQKSHRSFLLRGHNDELAKSWNHPSPCTAKGWTQFILNAERNTLLFWDTSLTKPYLSC